MLATFDRSRYANVTDAQFAALNAGQTVILIIGDDPATKQVFRVKVVQPPKSLGSFQILEIIHIGSAAVHDSDYDLNCIVWSDADGIFFEKE